MSFPYAVPEPPDGFDKMEKLFLREMIVNLYRVLPSTEDKFILIAVHEMGYSQDIVARMLGKSQVMVSIRLEKIKTFLKLHPIMANML